MRLATPDPPELSVELSLTLNPGVLKQLTAAVPIVVPDVFLNTPVALMLARGTPGGSVPGSGVAVVTGGVLSILMPLAVAGALIFPALSMQVPIAERFLPSVLRVIGAVQLAMPERASEPVNVTVTLVLFQPDTLGGGAAVAIAMGGVLSILIVADTEVEIPAPFRAIQVYVAPAVSAARATGSQPVVKSALIPEMASVTVQVNVTFVLFQPKAFGAGVIVGTTTGALVSIRTVTDAEADAP